MSHPKSFAPAWRACGLALALGAVSGACTAAATSPAHGRVVLPAGITPIEYRVAIEAHPAADAFDGQLDVDIRVDRATDRVVVNSAELQIASATIDDLPASAAVAFDTKRETATLAFDHRLAAGMHTLHVGYQGRIHAQAKGLFKLTYGTPAGPASALYTQFESADARRFLPCWDEPGVRAVFRLTATLPATEMAVSNMPVERTEPLDGGRQRVHFGATPRMSSYLLFYGAGDFERVHRDVDGIDVGVVVKRGSTGSAGYALDTAASVLRYYDDYFGVRYPLPKLDMVAAPGASTFFGAMENWGAIFYFEREVLVDPRTATMADRQGTYNVIAHEMAHQWFGNLVTMAWWDDLWLNEGFASWMQTKAADHAHPEWKRWLRLLTPKQGVMDVDARDGTHPIVQRIDDVEQAATAFDYIAYTKGALVIRTLEAYLGEDAFRDGVRRYMARHAYGNTVTDDLWRAMDEGSPRPVAAIAHDLTLQAGVPLVVEHSVACSGSRTTVVLSQDHFAIDPRSTPARRWRVPVVVAVPGGPPTRAVIAGPAPQRVTVEGCGPVVVNAGQTAYFRTRYGAEGYAALLAHYATLSPDDQLGLFNDSTALALSRQLPMASWLSLLDAMPAGVDPRIVSALASRLRDIDALYRGLPTQARWRDFASRVLRPMLASIGPQPVAEESANATIARGDLLAALAEFDDVALLAEARARFAAHVADPTAPLDPERRRFMLSVVASHADEATWDALHALARGAPTAMEKQELHEFMATTISPELAARMLALAHGGELPSTTVTSLVSDVGERHPRLAFDDALAHWDELAALFDPGADADYLPDMVGSAPDVELAARLQAFGAAHVPANARKRLDGAVSNMRWRASLRSERLPEIDRWLQARPAAVASGHASAAADIRRASGPCGVRRHSPLRWQPPSNCHRDD